MFDRGRGVERAREGRDTLRRRGWGRFGRCIAIGAGGATALCAALASAHTEPVTIPPDSDYVIRWFQPHSVQPVEDWEIEVTPRRNSAARFVATAQVMPDDSCWALNVPIAEPASVRIRSVSGSQVSAWSRATSVPEPGLASGITAAAGLLGFLSRRRRRAGGSQSS